MGDARVEPAGVRRFRKDKRLAVVDRMHELVGPGGDDRAGHKFGAVGQAAPVPQPGETKRLPVAAAKKMGDPGAPRHLPFVEPVHRNETAALREGVAKRRFRRQCFRAGIYERRNGRTRLGLRRHEAPVQQGELVSRLLRFFPDHRNH